MLKHVLASRETRLPIDGGLFESLTPLMNVVIIKNDKDIGSIN